MGQRDANQWEEQRTVFGDSGKGRKMNFLVTRVQCNSVSKARQCCFEADTSGLALSIVPANLT